MIIDNIYGIIAENVVDGIRDNIWEESVLNIEAYKKSYVKYKGFFISDGNQYELDMDAFNFKELKKSIYELLDIMGESNKWNKAVFKLLPTGKFDMNFEWDEELDQKRKKFQK